VQNVTFLTGSNKKCNFCNVYCLEANNSQQIEINHPNRTSMVFAFATSPERPNPGRYVRPSTRGGIWHHRKAFGLQIERSDPGIDLKGFFGSKTPIFSAKTRGFPPPFPNRERFDARHHSFIRKSLQEFIFHNFCKICAAMPTILVPEQTRAGPNIRSLRRFGRHDAMLASAAKPSPTREERNVEQKRGRNILDVCVHDRCGGNPGCVPVL